LLLYYNVISIKLFDQSAFSNCFPLPHPLNEQLHPAVIDSYTFRHCSTRAGEAAKIRVMGRPDPAIPPVIVPVAEAMVAQGAGGSYAAAEGGDGSLRSVSFKLFIGAKYI
jgi:hypothetical protein